MTKRYSKPVATLFVSLMLLPVLFASVASAQTIPPAMFFEDENGNNQPLEMTRYNAEVEVIGFVAETSVTMTFHNPNSRVLSGDLYFPLPEGATVSGYALDIEGTMVDGVAVEKHKARTTFESIVRQGIDPGLVEWTKGNKFKTRVFPIPANGSRTIRVSYVSNLTRLEDAEYRLPLQFENPIGEFSVRIEVIRPVERPQIVEGELAGLEFEPWSEGFIAETQQENFVPEDDLVISLPNVDRKPVLTQRAADGSIYFAVMAKSPVATDEAVARREAPGSVVIFWDASLSCADVDHSRELVLLRRWLRDAKERAPVGQDCSVQLVAFRNDVDAAQTFVLKDYDPDELIDAIEAIDYDGGTRLAELELPEGARPDVALLFSDGLNTFGAEGDTIDLGGVPLMAIAGGPTFDAGALRRMTLANGGEYVNLTEMSDEEALTALGGGASRFQGAASEGDAIDGLCPKTPQSWADYQLVCGRLIESEAQVAFRYRVKGEGRQEATFTITDEDVAEGEVLRKLWAQNRLNDLIVVEGEDSDKILELGQEHSLVTPRTSLIVLDSLEQYVEHEICPPESLPEMRNEYLQRMDTLEAQQGQEEENRIEQVAAQWQARLAWWRGEYEYPENFRYGNAEDADGRERSLGERLGSFFGLGSSADGINAEAEEDWARAEPMAEMPAMPGEGSDGGGEFAGEDYGALPRGSVELHDMAEEGVEYGLQDEMLPPGAMAGGMGGISPGDMSMNRPAPAAAMDMLAAENSSGRFMEGEPNASEQREPGIVVKPWDPNTPYLRKLERADAEVQYGVYLKQREQFGEAPSFYLDCASFFRENEQEDLALRVLSCLSELELEDPQILRVLGHRLVQWESLDLGIEIFEQVKKLRPEEPQSYRDLALALARRALVDPDTDPARRTESVRAGDERIRDDLTRAIDLLNTVVLGTWDGRFSGIEVIALEEANALLEPARAAGVSDIPLDKRLRKLLDVDVRIVMTWHADMTDIDLWVIEPSGEKVDYSHNRSVIGGLLSNDFTGGYGPEEYMVRRAMPGVYAIKAHYYGSSSVELLGSVTVQVDVYTNYGREDQQRQSLTFQLKTTQDVYDIGEIEW